MRRFVGIALVIVTARIRTGAHWEPAVYAMGEAWETRMRRLPVSRAPRAEEIAQAGNELVEENYTAAEARSLACGKQNAEHARLTHNVPDIPPSTLMQQPVT